MLPSLYSLTILTSPSSYEAGRPPPRGRPESLRVMTGRPPPRGRSEGPWCRGSLGRRVGKNQNLDNFLRKGTRVNRRAALIRRLSESPVRRFAGIAGALDNDNPSVRRGGQRPSGTTRPWLTMTNEGQSPHHAREAPTLRLASVAWNKAFRGF